ncbi:type I-E CRISPR-associated protein Cse2/CasB [Streptomyces griseorubiginosus]|uniref:type I-E CRISPR-associated protein Cse2/CasB n=1 Tax=Streptomyces griseorubiginosus TaxID=67304 RepID=UPI0036ACF07F
MPPTRTPSRDERRRHYDRYVDDVRDLCRTPRIRKRLEEGRGRPVEHCAAMDRYLIKHVAGFGARRAHYTIASLLAMERPTPNWSHSTPHPPPEPDPDTPQPAPELADDWTRRPTLGAALAQAARAHPHAAPGLQRNLEVLGVLSADRLHQHLPHIIGRLLKLDTACDFARLLEDLAQWDFARPQVTSRWRHDFYLTVPDTHLEL